MNQESLPRPKAMSASGVRAEALQARIDLLGGDIRDATLKITAFGDEIRTLGTTITNLLISGGQQALVDELKERELGLKDQQEKAEEQQAKLEAQQTKAENELAEIKAQDKIVFSGTAEVIALIGPKLDKNTLPLLGQLKDHLNTKPPANFPLDEKIFAVLKGMYGGMQEGPNVVQFFEKSHKTFLPGKIYTEWLVRDFFSDVDDKAEDCVHAAITPPIEHVLGYFLLEAGAHPRCSRNQTEDNKRLRSTTGSSRPDFLLHINNLLVFRGEEKKEGGSLDDAARELTSKMEVWNPLFFGDIPYIIGYAMAGTKFQLYALHPDLSKQSNVDGVPVLSTAVSDKLSLDAVADRILLVQYMINMVRVLQAFANMVPDDAPKLSDEYRNPRPYSGEYSKLVFETTYVRKVLANSAGSSRFDFDQLEELYDLIKGEKVLHTIQCKKGYPKLENARSGTCLMTLHLYPLGRCVLPDSAESLKLCLLTVLDALESMHKHSFVHRDVRWPNILQLANNLWMLIDLDFARKMDEEGFAPWPFWIDAYCTRGASWPPRDGDDGGWGKAKDVWMVGQLLEDMIEPDVPNPIAGVDLNSLAAEIKKCQSCAEAKAVVVSRLL
ncbi:hypothetical protein BASA81_007984 [Batrachochytrium salamandrivorans]|nr:hypothetical protein BASA81_007984 [Batrachochytrium salamandrivorans]